MQDIRSEVARLVSAHICSAHAAERRLPQRQSRLSRSFHIVATRPSRINLRVVLPLQVNRHLSRPTRHRSALRSVAQWLLCVAPCRWVYSLERRAPQESRHWIRRSPVGKRSQRLQLRVRRLQSDVEVHRPARAIPPLEEPRPAGPPIPPAW